MWQKESESNLGFCHPAQCLLLLFLSFLLFLLFFLIFFEKIGNSSVRLGWKCVMCADFLEQVYLCMKLRKNRTEDPGIKVARVGFVMKYLDFV